MTPFNTKQKEVLEHENRSEIFDFLKTYDKPASLAEIAEGADIPVLDIALYHLNRLVSVGLVEKVFGTSLYRVVGE